MTPAEALAALCALRPDLPPGFKVTLPLDWLSQAADGTAAQPAPSAGAPVDTSGDLDVAGLAARYHRQPSTVRGWLERGMFPGAFKLRGRDWRAPAAAVEAFDAAERQRGERGVGAAPLPHRGAEVTRRGKPVDLAAWRRTAS